jgi:hypothetical protein
MKRGTSQKKQARRRGVLSMELVLTLPILFLLMLAVFQFMLLFYSRSLIVEASRVGARKATLPGVTQEDVEDEIRRVLAPSLQTGMQVDVDFGEWTGDVVTVSVAVPMTAASPDLLWPIGFSLNGQNLYSETRMVRE